MSVTYYTTSGQTAFNVAVTVGLPVWDKVLPEPNEKVSFRQKFVQTAASYSPLALDTQYPAQGQYGVPSTPTYYLVDETGFSDKRGGLLEWDRVYSRVPSSWSDGEEYAYTYPGYVASLAAGTAYNVTAITASGTGFELATNATGISASDQVFFELYFTRGGLTYSAVAFGKATAANSGVSVTISNGLPGAGTFSSVTGIVRKSAPGRTSAKTYVVGSRIVNDYAISTVASLDQNLPIIDKFTVVSSTGDEVDYISTGTATRPNSPSYATLILNSSEIVAESSTRRRFLGNIYVRSTRLVPAR